VVVLPEDPFEHWVIEPTRRIVAALKRRFPDHPVGRLIGSIIAAVVSAIILIAFPRLIKRA
jgi:hypothetical protein